MIKIETFYISLMPYVINFPYLMTPYQSQNSQKLSLYFVTAG